MQRDALAIIDDLTELIDAIDRRSPHLQRRGEGEIGARARDRRAPACARIADLKSTTVRPAGDGGVDQPRAFDQRRRS